MNDKANVLLDAITPQIQQYADFCADRCFIEPSLYAQHQVNRGLRDINGKGVLTGLTEISEIVSKEIRNGTEVPCNGQLYYRGYDVKKIVSGFIQDKRNGFEEVVYLLLFGELPKSDELSTFEALLSSYRSLPGSFVRDIIMKAPSDNMMNSLARSVLTLYSYDADPENTSIPNVLRQCLQLIARFPLLSVYSYHAYNYYLCGNGSFFIHEPDPALSTAENILYMLRIDGAYTPLEASVLDAALVLHAEHGGGNNSTFTTHVVSSSGTDTYSAIAAALGSLKGPKHGGANSMVCAMFADIKEHVKNWTDEEEIARYLEKILHKEAFDKAGLIYGLGHAVYSVSDPRAEVFKTFVENLSKEKGLLAEYNLYSAVERIGTSLIAKERKIYKGVSANIDFYSGFVYQMLGLPPELYTSLFATARIAGWSAHRIEELLNAGKIIRPAYLNVKERREYIPLENR